MEIENVETTAKPGTLADKVKSYREWILIITAFITFLGYVGVRFSFGTTTDQIQQLHVDMGQRIKEVTELQAKVLTLQQNYNDADRESARVDQRLRDLERQVYKDNPPQDRDHSKR